MHVILYSFGKNDRIYPVITIVLSNAEKWDGPRNLRNILDLKSIPVELRKFVSGYKLNIIEIPKMTAADTARYRTDLKQVFDLLRCYRDQDELEALLRGNEDYDAISSDAYELMNEYVNLEKYGLADDSTGGNNNMKNGFDGIIEKYTNIGREQGIEQGIKQGIHIFIEDKVDEGVPRATIKERLIKRFHLDADKAEEYLLQYAPAQTA